MQDIESKLQQYAQQVSNYLDQYGIKNSVDHITGNNITDVTLEYAQKDNADLISIMTEQEKSLSNLLLGSYAYQMINKSPIPVLLFPTKQIGIITGSFKTAGINY